jgi:hypothetical protein
MASANEINEDMLRMLRDSGGLIQGASDPEVNPSIVLAGPVAVQQMDASTQEVNPEINPTIAHAGPTVVQQVDASTQEVNPEINPEINPSIAHEGSASSLAVLGGEARAPTQEPASIRRRWRRVDLRWVIPPPAPPGWGWRGEGRIIVSAGAGHCVFAIFPGQREVRVLVRVDSNGVQTIVRSPRRRPRPG